MSLLAGAARWSGVLVVCASALACTSDLKTDLSGAGPLTTDPDDDAPSMADDDVDSNDDDLADDAPIGPNDDADDDLGSGEDDGGAGDDDVPTGDDDAADDDLDPDDDLDQGGDGGPADDTTDPSIETDAGSGAIELLSTIPAHEATDVATDANLMLEFDREITPGTGAISLVERLSSAVVEAVSVSGDPRIAVEGSRVVVDWTTTLQSSTSYSIVLDPEAIQDERGNSFDGLSRVDALWFSTVAPRAPVLEATFPEDGATDVPLDAEITLTFDVPIAAGQLGSLSVVDASDLAVVQSILVGDTTSVDISGSSVTFQLEAPLSWATDYFVTLEEGAIRSIDGAPFAGFADDTVLAFTTVSPSEVVLVSTAPADDALNVDPSTPLVFTFSEPVVPGAGAISIFLGADGDLVEAVPIDSPSVTFSSETVTVDPAATLGSSTEYYVLVEAGAIQSTLGSEFAGIDDPTVFSFTTAAAAPDPLTLSSTSPENGATDVSVSTDLALTFSEDVVAGSGNVTIHAADGTVFEVISVTGGQTSIAGATVTLDPVGTLRGNTTYYVLVTAGSFESLSGASYAGLLDTAEFRFTTETSFELIDLDPPDGATDVEVSTHFTLTFSDPVEVVSGDLRVVQTSNGDVVETVPLTDGRVDVSANVVTVDLDTLLDDETAHHVEVDAGAIVQAGGSATFGGISGATAWNFTTGAVTKPGSVANGLVVWLDADHAASIKTASGVRYWADRSGQHNDVSNTTASERPSIVADAIGGRAAIRFDGDDDWLGASDGLDLASAEGFIVWESSAAPSTSDKRSIFVNGENLEVNHGHPFLPNSVVSCTSSPCEGSAFAAVEITPGAAADTTTLWHFGFDAVTTSLFGAAQGGALSFQPAPTTPPVTPTFPLGIGGHDDACEATDGCWFEGDVAEVVLYSRRLTQAERLAVIDYLRDKWNVPDVACGASEILGANGSCYFVQTTADDWTGARDACTGRGAGWNLATVRSELDHDEVTGLLGAVSNAWIGGSDSDVPNTWRWVSDTLQFWNGTSATSGGTPSNGSYTLWRTGEPSSTTDEGCARYNLASDEWAWADDVCATAHPSICEGPGN